jgi:hypothetical protein
MERDNNHFRTAYAGSGDKEAAHGHPVIRHTFTICRSAGKTAILL